MRPSELKEKNDKYVAWMVTIILHASIIAALIFVSIPKKDTNMKGEIPKQEISKNVSNVPKA